SAPTKEASQRLINGASTPPLRGGECCTVPIDSRLDRAPLLQLPDSTHLLSTTVARVGGVEAKATLPSRVSDPLQKSLSIQCFLSPGCLASSVHEQSLMMRTFDDAAAEGQL